MKKNFFLLVMMSLFTNNIMAQYGPRLMQLDMFMYQMNQAMMQQQMNSTFQKQSVPEVDWSKVFSDDNKSSTSVPETSRNNNRSTQESQQSSRNTTTRRKCSYCNNGRKVHESSVPNYGQTPYKKKCIECGAVYMSTTSHAHISCGHCGGRGYVEY